MQESIFKNKNFTLSLLGALVSNIGSVFYSFVVGFWLLELTDKNAFVQGSYLGMCGVVYVVVMLFGGVLADHFNKAKIMYVCDYLKGLLIALTTVAVLLSESSTASIVVLFVCGALSNAIAAVFSPASASIYPLIVPEEQLQQANACQSALLTFQGIIGTVLAGILYSVAPPYVIFFIVAGCYIASGVSEMFIRYEDVGSGQRLTIRDSLTDIKEGASYIAKTRYLLVFMMIILIINFFFSPISENFLPYFIKTDVASNDHLLSDVVSPEMWQSVFLTAFSIGSIIFAVVISSKSVADKVTSGLKLTISGIAALFTVETAAYYVLVLRNVSFNAFLIVTMLVFFGVGSMLSLTNIPVTTKLQTIVERDKLGKVNAILEVGAQGLIPLAVFLAGIVLEYAGIFPLLILCTAGMVIPVVLLFVCKSVRDF